MKDSTPAVFQEPEGRKISTSGGLAICACTLFVVFAVFGARPAVHWAKGRRARHFAAESEEFIAAAKWQEAFSKAQAAYQLKSDEPDALRAMAHFYEKTRPASAVPFLRIIAGLDGVTQRDLSEYAEACLRQRNFAEAEAQITRLLQMDPSNPENLRLAARVYGGAGNTTEGLRFAGEAKQREPQNLAGRLLEARLQIASTDTALQKSGWDTIWDLAHGKGPEALESLHLLPHKRDLSDAQEEELSKLLRAQSEEEDRLLGFEVEMRFHPERREKIVADAIAQAKGEDGNALRVLAIWLNGLHEYTKTLELLPEKLAVSRQDLFLVYLDSLAAMNRWKDVERLLAMKDVPLDDVYLHIFRARAAEEGGRKDEAEFEWRRAHTAATGNPSQMYYVAQYAERVGREDQAILAYQTLASDFATARIAYEALLRLAQARGDTNGVRNLLEAMMTRWQSEPAVRNDYAYINLLLGRNLAQNRNTALGLVSALPNELPHRTTLALGLLRTGDLQSALNVYSGLTIPWAQAPDRDKAVYAAVLGANGEKDAAAKMAALVTRSNLFQEERDLIRQFVEQPRPSPSPAPTPG